MDKSLHYYALMHDFAMHDHLRRSNAKYSVKVGYKHPGFKGYPDDWVVTIEPDDAEIAVHVRMHSTEGSLLAIVKKRTFHEWCNTDNMQGLDRKSNPISSKISVLRYSIPNQYVGGMMMSGKKLRCPTTGKAEGFIAACGFSYMTVLLGLMCKGDKMVVAGEGKDKMHLHFPVTGIATCLGHLVRNGLYQISPGQELPPFQALDRAAYINDFERKTGKFHALAE